MLKICYICSMKRYHKQLGFNKVDIQELKEINQRFNDDDTFKKTEHGLDRLQEKFNFMEVMLFLKDTIAFNYEDIFEYYTEDGKVIKVVYRVHFDAYDDIIVVLTRNKTIVTAWINKKNDNHKTLDTKQYTTV